MIAIMMLVIAESQGDGVVSILCLLHDAHHHSLHANDGIDGVDMMVT